MALLLGALAFEHNTLQFFKDDELLICVVNFRISLFLRDKKTCLLETLELALNITGIFFDELRKPTDVRFEIRILRIDYDYLTANSGSDKYI